VAKHELTQEGQRCFLTECNQVQYRKDFSGWW